MKLLVCDQNVFSEEQVINFYHKKSKLDKSCALYDRKLEKAFRANIESFVKWLEEAQEDSDSNEEDSGEEAKGEEEVKEAPKQPEETEFQRT